MKVKRITDIDTALYIYYRYPEIGNKEIKELFGGLGSAALTKYKKAVQGEQIKQNVKTCGSARRLLCIRSIPKWHMKCGALMLQNLKNAEINLKN